MVKCHLTLDDHRDHCLGSWWLRLRCEKIRDWFLQVARLFEVEAQLLHHTSLQISESKALITTVEALLGAVRDGAHSGTSRFRANPRWHDVRPRMYIISCRSVRSVHDEPVSAKGIGLGGWDRVMNSLHLVLS